MAFQWTRRQIVCVNVATRVLTWTWTTTRQQVTSIGLTCLDFHPLSRTSHTPHSPAHNFTRLPTDSLTHPHGSLAHCKAYSLTHALTHPPTHSFIHSLTHPHGSLTHTLTHHVHPLTLPRRAHVTAECFAHTECDVGEYENPRGNATTNTNCSAWKFCPAGYVHCHPPPPPPMPALTLENDAPPPHTHMHTPPPTPPPLIPPTLPTLYWRHLPHRLLRFLACRQKANDSFVTPWFDQDRVCVPCPEGQFISTSNHEQTNCIVWSSGCGVDQCVAHIPRPYCCSVSRGTPSELADSSTALVPTY
jgi:hypothetical protein